MQTIYDDPFRTASPYEAPGEISMEWVSSDEAVYEVFHAIRTGQWAYGKSAYDLVDLLMDAIEAHEDMLVKELLLMWDNVDIQDTCEELANYGLY